jgi:hypothetical protein
MGFLDSVKAMFSGPAADNSYWLYVRCKRCGEVIKTRVDLLNDLSLQDEGGYVTHKTVVGNQLCFQRIEVTLHFDSQRRLTGEDIAHGEIISADDYEQSAGQS